MNISSKNCSISSSQFQDNYFSGETKYIPLLKWIETTFDCSGLCTKETFYLFSNINRGESVNSCLSEVHSWAKDHFLTYGIISIILGLYMVLYI